MFSNGKYPATEAKKKRAEELTAKGNTFRVAAREHITFREGVLAHARSVYEWYIHDILPADFYERPPDGIMSGVMTDTLLNVHRSGRQETARRVRFFISRVFQHASVRGRTERNPVVATKGILPTRRKRNYAAITDPNELGSLLEAIDEYEGWPTLRWALQIAACGPQT